MHSNVNSFLGFDEGCIPNRECVVIGQANDSASFLLHQIMSAALKERKSVLLTSFIQKFHHYNTVSQKIGTSLKSATEAKQFLFFDGLEDFANSFYPEEHSLNLIPAYSLNMLKVKIMKYLSDLRDPTINDIVLVIDDLSVLISMGYHVGDVCMFMKDIQETVVGLNSSLHDHQGTGSSVVVLCSYDEEDKDSVSLWQFLVNLSTMDVDVTGLQTGYCKDVHGQACVTWRNRMDVPGQRSVSSVSKTRQFKLTDNSVEFFAAGTSAAVL